MIVKCEILKYLLTMKLL